MIPDIHINRRDFLGGSAAFATLAGLPKMSFAALPTDRRLVLVILRGGMDGLAAVPAYGDRYYASARGAMALPMPGRADGILDLDGFFGLHPKMTAAHKLFKRGDLACVHGVALPYRERSHFDAQNLMEIGGSRPHERHDGWLNRAIGLYGADADGLGLAIGQSVPMVMFGRNSVGSWAPSRKSPPRADFADRLLRMYDRDPMFHAAMSEAFDVYEMTQDTLGDMQDMLRRDRRNGLETGAKIIGDMLTDPKGPRIATVEINGWDTHAGQGAANGKLANMLAALSDGMGALAGGLAPVWDKTAVVVVTEFGRTVSANGTGGTDHGTAGVAFVAGGAVNGGRVYGRWPGLDKAQQFEGRDLAPTTDMRALFKAALHGHMDLPRRELDSIVFPGSAEVSPLRDLFKT